MVEWRYEAFQQRIKSENAIIFGKSNKNKFTEVTYDSNVLWSEFNNIIKCKSALLLFYLIVLLLCTVDQTK